MIKIGIFLVSLYIFVTVILLFNATSRKVFSPNENAQELFYLRIITIVMWPIAVFSIRGRKYLLEAWRGID